MLGGLDLDAEKLTVEEFLTRWLASVKTSVAPGTFVRYEQAARCHLIPELGTLKLSKLGPAHVEFFKSSLLAKGLTPSTVRTTLIILSVALNRAVKWELLARNLAGGITRPKVADSGYVCLSEEEAAKLVAYTRVASPRDEALYYLALKYGPRESELCSLRWGDVDLARAALTIRTSKTGEGRTLRHSPGTVEVLERHRKILLKEGVASLARGKGLVFPNELGVRRSPSSVLWHLRKHLKAAGLPRIRFHDLRDTAATLMLEDGFPVHRVARILGHKDPAMTLRRYAHVLAELKEAGAERLDRWAF